MKIILEGDLGRKTIMEGNLGRKAILEGDDEIVALIQLTIKISNHCGQCVLT